MDDVARCGCPDTRLSFWDDPPEHRYEIVLCRSCGATWAWDYNSDVGNFEASDNWELAPVQHA